MSEATDDVLRRFAAKLTMSGHEVGPLQPGQVEVHVIRHGQALDLVFSESELDRLLDDGAEDAVALWGPSVSVEESVARLMTIHLDESLDTATDADVGGRWLYDGGFFRRHPR